MNKIFKNGYKVTQHYGENPQIYSKFGLKGHEGLDIIPTDSDWDVYAVESGVVIRDYDDARQGGAYGNYITIWNQDKKRAWFYCHNTVNYVSLGDLVTKGQKISKMGNTGNSTGAHMHISLAETDAQGTRVNTNNGYQGFIDPEPVIKELAEDKGLVGYDGKSREADWYVREWGDEKQEKEKAISELKDSQALVGKKEARITQLEQEAATKTKELRETIEELEEKIEQLEKELTEKTELCGKLAREIEASNTAGYGSRIIELENQLTEQDQEIKSLKKIKEKAITAYSITDLIIEIKDRILRR